MTKAKEKTSTSTKTKGRLEAKPVATKAPANTKSTTASKAAAEGELHGPGAASSAGASQAQGTAAAGSPPVANKSEDGAKAGPPEMEPRKREEAKKRKREKKKKDESKPRRDDSRGHKNRKKEETEPAMPCYAPPAENELAKELVPLACQAFRDKLRKAKGGKDVRDRRTNERPFQLLKSQASTLSSRYQAARNQDRRVDYSTIAGKPNFASFAGHAEKLAAYEPWLLEQIEIAYKEIGGDTSISNDVRIPDLTMELISEAGGVRAMDSVEISSVLVEALELDQAARQLTGAKRSAPTTSRLESENELEDKADPAQINAKLQEEFFRLQAKMAADLKQKDKDYQAKLDQAKAVHDAAIQQVRQEMANERAIYSGVQKKLASTELQLAAAAKQKQLQDNHFHEVLKAHKTRVEAKFQGLEAAQAEKVKTLEIRESELSAKEHAFEMEKQQLKSWSDELKTKEGMLKTAENERKKNYDGNISDEAMKAHKAAQEEKAKSVETGEKGLAYDKQQLKAWADKLKVNEKTLKIAENKWKKKNDETEASIAKLEKLRLEISRQQKSLQQQLGHNGYSMQMTALTNSRDYYAREYQRLREDLRLLGPDLDSTKSELVLIKNRSHNLQVERDDLELKLASYTMSSVIEGKIVCFTSEHAVIGDGELPTLLKKCDFIVHKMQETGRHDVAQQEKFRSCVSSFWQQRNQLVHDKTGQFVHKMDHLQYQQVLRAIDEIMDDVQISTSSCHSLALG